MVEGEKLVHELLHSDFRLNYIIATPDKLAVLDIEFQEVPVREISEGDYQKISSLSTPPGLGAVVEIPTVNDDSGEIWHNSLYLDGIKDPGNLGTIIRIADWYGVSDVYCSEDTVDCYNPKVLSATMGSIARVRITYLSFDTFIERCKIQKLAMVMNGKSVHRFPFPAQAAIVIGSESHGIRQENLKKCDDLLTIEKHGGAESLNAAIATAIVFDRLVNR